MYDLRRRCSPVNDRKLGKGLDVLLAVQPAVAAASGGISRSRVQGDQ